MSADTHGDAMLEHLIDPDPRARQVPGIGRVVEPPITGSPGTPGRGPRVVVRRSRITGEWQAHLVHLMGDSGALTPVGTFRSMSEAVRTGITAARFVAAGIPWRVAS